MMNPARAASRYPYGSMSVATTSDPFATYPVAKSLALIGAGLPAATLTFVPRLLETLLAANPVIAGVVGVFMALSILTWAGMVFGVIVLFICAIEGVVALVKWLLTRHLTPVDRLEVSERVRAMLHRHGYHTAEHLAAAPQAELRSYPNFDDRLLREVARALYLWEQERRDDRHDRAA